MLNHDVVGVAAPDSRSPHQYRSFRPQTVLQSANRRAEMCNFVDVSEFISPTILIYFWSFVRNVGVIEIEQNFEYPCSRGAKS
jgi:hypothetical protein